MISRTLTVTAKVGLHARPVALLSKIAKDLQEEDIQIMLGRDKEHLVSAASALRMLTLKIAFGEEIIVELGTDNSQRADEIFLLVAEAFAAE